MSKEGHMTLPEVMYHNIDVSGGVRTPPLIQIIYKYVCTHAHRTPPLHSPWVERGILGGSVYSLDREVTSKCYSVQVQGKPADYLGISPDAPQASGAKPGVSRDDPGPASD